MAQSDIRPFGAGDGTAFYWVRTVSTAVSGGHLSLVAIDEFGEITSTPIRAEWDPAAMTREEAVRVHLSGAITEADRDLERRRREAPEPDPMPPQTDPATARFFGDD